VVARRGAVPGKRRAAAHAHIARHHRRRATPPLDVTLPSPLLLPIPSPLTSRGPG
jgi:hypothetical protein